VVAFLFNVNKMVHSCIKWS